MNAPLLPIERLNRDILDIDDDPALNPAEKGQRIKALVAARRAGAFTTGASIHYYTGRMRDAADPLDRLAALRLAVAKRVHKGQPDGIGGSAGGLAKRLSSTRLDGTLPDEAEIIGAFGHNIVSAALLQRHGPYEPALKRAILNVFDDVVERPDGTLGVTDDPAVILDKNIRREAREELGEKAYALMRPVLDKTPFHVALTGIIDDRYVCTPSWWRDAFLKDGVLAYPCTATAVYMQVDEDVFDALLSLTAQVDGGDGEVAGLAAIPLADALTRLSAAGHGHCGHNPEFHYRYGHEGLVPWKIAADLLGRDPAQLATLARALAPCFAADNRLDFQQIARQAKTTLSGLDGQFGLPAGSFAQLQQAVDDPAIPARKWGL